MSRGPLRPHRSRVYPPTTASRARRALAARAAFGEVQPLGRFRGDDRAGSYSSVHVNASESSGSVLRVAALVALLFAIVLVLGSWDGLYDALELPQALPALPAQIGGAAFAGLAYLLFSAASRPELAATAAGAGTIAQGGSAALIAAWVIFRGKDDLGVDTAGIVVVIVAAVVLAGLALGLARVARSSR